jgi:hypothetical protein
LSKTYRGCTATTSLADHLLRRALLVIAITWGAADLGETGVNPALTEVWRELGLPDVEDLEASSTKDEDEPFPGLPGNAPVDICEFKCTWWTVFFIGTGLLWENCGGGWRVIGACLEG